MSRFEDYVDALGLSLVIGPAMLAVDPSGWEHVACTVKVSLPSGQELYQGPWKQGIACVEPGGRSIAAQESRRRNVQAGNWKRPKLADVMYSLILDAAADLDAESFEGWAGNYGYDTDSIKARDTYETCLAIGRTFRRSLSVDQIDRLRELASDY